MSWTNTRMLMVVAIGPLLLLGSYLFRNFALLMISVSFIFVLLAFTRSLFRSLYIFLASLMCALSVAELLVSFFDSNKGAYFDKTSSYITRYWRKTDIGMLASEGVHSSKKISPSGEVIYEVNYKIGTDGFRITDQSLGRKERINFFGCSFTFGEGLKDNETLPYYYAQLSNSFEVKNFGFHGFGGHQAVAIMQSDRDTSGKRNFFLTAPWHAPRSACKHSWTAHSPRFVLVNNNLKLSGTCEEFNNNFDANDILEKVLHHSNIYKLIDKIYKFKYLSDEDFNLYFALVQKMHSISKDRGQEFIVGFVKADKDFFKGTTHTNQTIFEALRSRSDRIIDLTLADSVELLDRKYFIHELDKHPSDRANKERAMRAVEFIEQ
jgi:hypothetical protein